MLYIFDSTENLITTLPKGSFFNAVHREVLNGENTFQFTVPADNEYVVEGNLVAFRDLDSYWQVFEIKRLVDLHGDGLTRTAFCEHILYELLDDIVIDKRPSADATAALAGMLDGTRWQVGIVDNLGAASTSAYYISALEAVQKVAEAWQGELNWRCVINGGVITRYVDLRAMVGSDTGKQFVYSKDILNIEREVDSSSVVTALYGRGKGIELDSGSYGRRLTFADVVAADKPAGQEWIGDDDALSRWGRNGRHRFDVFIDEEETDPEVLLQKTRDELARRKVPRVSYRLDVVSLEQLTGYEHEKVRKGDLVRVIDREFTPELVVSARVIDIERDPLDPLDPVNTKVVLGSFAPTIVEATINTARRVDEMANRPFNTKWLDGKINVLQNTIENTQSYVFQTGEDGILILDAATYDQATQAMKLGGGIFAIANQKDGQGGWNWRTFGDGSGFTADLITAGILDAGLVQIGPQTTFAPGYDPSQIEGASAVGMGVDSDCTGLWHFDGSLNSHKGVAAIGDANFDTGCFGQAVKIEEGTTNILDYDSNFSVWSSAGNMNVLTSKTGKHSFKVQGTSTSPGAYAYVYPNFTTSNVHHSLSCKVKNNNSKNLTTRILIRDDVNGTLISDEKYYTIAPGETKYLQVSTTSPVSSSRVTFAISVFSDSSDGTVNAEVFEVQGEAKDHSTPFVDGTRLGVLKAPTTGLSASQGTISFRAKNLSESAYGSVLVDLPDNVGNQGIFCGIADDGNLFIEDVELQFQSVETSQADFQTGTLSGTVATSSGNLELARDGMDFTYVETTQPEFNSGTLTDVTATSAGDLELKTARNSMGKALSFDGVDDYVDCGNKASLNFTSRVTLEAWVKGNAFNLWSDIISKGVSYGSKVAYMLGVSNDGRLWFEINVGGVRYCVAWSGMQQYVGQWVHVAGVYDRSRLILYVNGEEQAAISLNNLDIDIVSTPVRICAPNRPFNGIIDDVRIWNVARTQQQIQDNMNKELVGNESGLVGYWKFNEGSGATAYDSTPNANNGAINGASWTNGPPKTYKFLGTRETVVDISGANPAGGAKIEWSKTTPTGTTVTVETALSLDGGSTYGAYAEATSGSSIPGIASDTDLSNAKLKIKETLSTTDTSITPKLHSLSVYIYAPYKSSGYRYKEYDISAVGSVGSSKISWTENKPASTTLTVKAAVSTDGGSSYSSFQPCTNGGSIPGLTQGMDVSNARLKVQEDLATSDGTKTPQLQSLTIEVGSDVQRAYGPNKSTLTGWDSISLAWKPERLSLVVNDSEACYIENPGLPAALGSHIFIGTDRNGANAINTLVDELRIDKVYREVNIRTGWHKTGVPFYTSEDMKQWPGYVKVETDGLKVYDSQEQLRVLLGSWLDSAIRKYGIKIIGGEIYSAYISTKDPGNTNPYQAYAEIDTNGNITIYDIQGQKGMVMSGLSGQGSVNWFYDGEQYANAFVNAGESKDFIIWTLKDNSGITLSPSGQVTGLRLGSTNAGGNVELKGENTDIKGTQQINLTTGGDGWISINAGSGGIVQIIGSTTVIGNLSATGSKPAQQVTENYGLRYLYATEAPEVIYYDRGVVHLENGEVTIYLDPIFLECIEPDTELTPWQIWVECYGENDVKVAEIGANYFKVKERNGGTSNNKVIWRLEAVRNGYAGIRLMEVVD